MLACIARETPATILPPRLTLCVDDLGLHAGIHQAAEMLAAMGRIGAVSCMVGAPAWHAAAKAAAAIASLPVGVGLHLDLTEHTLDPRCRASLAEWMARSALGRIDTARLRAEIEAQLDRFETSLAREPAHVDGHRHVHQLPGVREVLLTVLAGRYGTEPWVRSTRAPAAAGAKARVVEALGERGLRELCETTGIAQNGHLLGVYALHGGADRYLALLTGWLRCARDGDLLVCHPSLASDGVAFGAARRCEFDVLAGPGFEALVRLSGLQLGPLVPHAMPAA